MDHKQWLLWGMGFIAFLVCGLLLVLFLGQRRSKIVCSEVVIMIENTDDNHFIAEPEILKTMQSTGKTIVGQILDQIDLRALEQTLLSNRYIADAQLYSNVKGTLIAQVTLHRPLARIIHPDAPDQYVAEDGTLMPISDTFTARTTLVSGYSLKESRTVKNIYETQQGAALMETLNYINEHEFWKAQVAQLDFDARGKITIYPQITGQRVEFGRLTDIETKFKKLMIFYRKILPQKGWTHYRRVNIEYENQIIAE